MARIKDVFTCCPIKNRRGSIRDILHDNELDQSSEIREMVCEVIQLLLLSLLLQATSCKQLRIS